MVAQHVLDTDHLEPNPFVQERMETAREGEINRRDMDSSLLTSEETESLSSDVLCVESMIPSGLEIPTFTWRTMKQLFTKCIAEAFPTVEQRCQSMSAENAALLNGKSHLIVEMISHEILRVVIPQVLAQDGFNNLRYTHVTEGDILHSFGYSFDIGIREALSLAGLQCVVTLDKLKQLIAAEVVHTVNCSLDLVIDQYAIEMEPNKCVLMHPKKISDLFGLVLMSCDLKRPGSCAEVPAEAQKDVGSGRLSYEVLDDREQELLARDRSFIAKFVPALVTCITAHSKTSMYDLDLTGMLAHLEECTVGKLSFTFPKNIDQIHIVIYKKLCREFGCAKQQHLAIVSVDRYFEATIVRLLKEELQRPEKDGFVDKMKKIFKKGSRKSVEDSEEAGLSSSSTIIRRLTPEKSEQLPVDKFGQL